jgi:hypothetical protein
MKTKKHFYHISLSSPYKQKRFRQKLQRNLKHAFHVQHIYIYFNIAIYEILWKDTDDNMARAHCMIDTQGYKHTLRIRNIYCFSIATMVTRSRLNVTLNVHGLSFLFQFLFFSHLSFHPPVPVIFNSLLHCELGWQYELGSEGLLDCTVDECRS